MGTVFLVIVVVLVLAVIGLGRWMQRGGSMAAPGQTTARLVNPWASGCLV